MPQPPRQLSTTELIAGLERALRIDRHALDEALQQQPDLYYRGAQALALAKSRMDAAKEAAADLESDVEIGIREEVVAREEKLTEGAIKAMLRSDPQVREAAQKYLALKREVGQLSALVDSYEQRSYMLRELVGLYIAGYNSDNTAQRNHGNLLVERGRRRLAATEQQQPQPRHRTEEARYRR